MTWVKNIAGVLFAFAAPLTVSASAIFLYAICAFGEPPVPFQLLLAGGLWAASAVCVWGAFKFRFRSDLNRRP